MKTAFLNIILINKNICGLHGYVLVWFHFWKINAEFFSLFVWFPFLIFIYIFLTVSFQNRVIFWQPNPFYGHSLVVLSNVCFSVHLVCQNYQLKKNVLLDLCQHSAICIAAKWLTLYQSTLHKYRSFWSANSAIDDVLSYVLTTSTKTEKHLTQFNRKTRCWNNYHN